MGSRRNLRFGFGFLLLVVTAAVAEGRILRVAQDGDSSSFVTIQAALEAAASGDSVFVAPGSYHEPDAAHSIHVDGKSLLIMGTGSGPDDCQVEIGLWFTFCDTLRIEKLSFHDSELPLSLDSSGTSIVNCVFTNNVSGVDGQGGAVYGNGTRLSITNCSFIGNHATSTQPETARGGAVNWGGGHAAIEACVFDGNESTFQAGAVFGNDHLALEGCVLIRNKAPHGAAAMLCYEPDIGNCTIALNEVTDGAIGAAVEGCEYWGNVVANTIVALTVHGWGIECADVPKTLYCCDVWGNEMGDFGGMWCDHSGSISADPLFCDIQNGNASLGEGSPCLPRHGGCGQIGALGMGCSVNPVERSTWGRVRLLFR